MKKSIKIIVAILIILMLMLATKSYAALESKPENSRILTKEKKKPIEAFQLCYDMRDPTSSLGNNSLDTHLQLNKDVGAYAYLGMSAYGTNGKRATINWDIAVNVEWTTPNRTGIAYYMINDSEATAGVKGSDSDLIKKYGTTKYTEMIDTNLNIENTKGMALIETKNWHSSEFRNTEGYKAIMRYNPHQAYGYISQTELSTCYFRPVIWNQ